MSPTLQREVTCYICEAYSYFEATFAALGVNVSGDEGLLVVRAPCLTKNERLIGPVSLPVRQMSRDVIRQSFHVEDQDISIRIYGISFSLASRWLLTSVRFFNSPEEEGFSVEYESGSKSYFEITPI